MYTTVYNFTIITRMASKSKPIPVRFSHADIEAISKAASVDKLSVSAWIRQAVLRAVDAHSAARTGNTRDSGARTARK